MRARTPERSLHSLFRGYGGYERFLAKHILFPFSPPPPSTMFFVTFLLSASSMWDRRCVCRPESGGLSPSSDHSRWPLPCCKTQARPGTADHCASPYHPDFTSGFRRDPFFVSSQKKAFAQGRGGVFLLLPLTGRLKERLMGENLPRKPGCILAGQGQLSHCPWAMFFVNYLSLCPFIKEKSSKAGRKEQDIGVRGPLRPPRYSI